MGVNLVAVDPGEKYIGIAHFDAVHDIKCADWAMTIDPHQAVPMLWQYMDDRRIDHLVVEEWRIQPGNLGAAWSTCFTAEVIGALRFYAQKLGVPFDTLPPRVKKPAEGYVRRNLALRLVGDTVHARDAELIGWAWLNGVRA